MPDPEVGRGDAGMTDLPGLGRVHKDDVRIEALGALDEAQSAVGMARTQVADATAREALRQVETRLSTAMAEVAATDPARLKDRIGAADVAALEAALAGAPRFSGFVLPGETPRSATLHVARTAVRRAERRVVALQRHDHLDAPALLAYLNRLSSLLYALAQGG